MAMDITLVYAIGFGSTLGLMILARPAYFLIRVLFPLAVELMQISPLLRIARYISRLVSRHLLYPTILRRGMIMDRWSRLDFLVLFIYMGANVACLAIQPQGISEAGLRAGILALTNAIFLFASPHLSFLADRLGVSIHTCRRMHVFVALVSFLLAAFHTIVGTATKGKYKLDTPQNIWALVVGTFLLPIYYLPQLISSRVSSPLLRK